MLWLRHARRVLALCALASLLVHAQVVQGEVEFDVLWTGSELCIEDFPVRASVIWDVSEVDASGVEVKVGAPDGNLFSSSGLSGSSETGAWVTESTEFFLVARPSGNVLASASMETPSCESLRRAERQERALQTMETSPDAVRFEVSPARLFYCGRRIERTAVALEWDVSELEASRVEIFLGSRDGSLFSTGHESGQAKTRDWVTDGMTFVLYLPEFDLVAATHEFRILPCSEVGD